jgi:GNAT superfamily N-acetyltransferase
VVHDLAVSLRPAQITDAALFYDVTAQTMRDHIIATWGAWDEGRVRQEALEHASSPNAQVVLVGPSAVGVLTVEHHSDHVQLEQLYLLPQYQRLGIGTHLVKCILNLAQAAGVPLRLRVLAVNPARRFYEQLGFVAKEVTRERVHMERAP